MSVKRSLFRLTQVFDYRTFAVAGAFLSVLIAGALVIDSAQTARQALKSQDASRKAASRRIDLLSREAANRDTQIRSLVATVARQQTGMDALSEQIRRMGGQPIVVVRNAGPTSVEVVSSPSPRSTVWPSATPTSRQSSSPRPSPSTSPSPSPTCRALPILGCRGAR